jgi:hypothetical protein
MIDVIALLLFFAMVWIILCSIVPMVYIVCERFWNKLADHEKLNHKGAKCTTC